jgi:hypothetical protein
MSQEIVKHATCICGEVRIRAAHVSRHVGACHCHMCRKWGGGPFMEVDCGTEVSFEGEQNISVFDSSEWAERGFCSKCGSHLFYRLKDTKQHMIPVGLFDEINNFSFDHQVFIDKKPDYYRFANKTKNMTQSEVFAMYAPEQEEAGS